MNQQQYPQNVAPAGHRTATWDWNGANTSGAFLLEARTLRSCADKQPDSKTEVVFEKGGIRAFHDVEQQKSTLLVVLMVFLSGSAELEPKQFFRGRARCRWSGTLSIVGSRGDCVASGRGWWLEQGTDQHKDTGFQ